MAISIDAISNSPGNTTWSHTVGTGDNRLLVVLIGTHNVELVTGVTYGGVSLTLAKEQNGSYRDARIYYLTNPTSGAANIIVSGTFTSYGCACCAISFEEVLQSAPIRGVAGVNGTSYTPSLNISSAVLDVVIDVVCLISSGTSSAYVPGSGQTERFDFRAKSGGASVGVSTKNGASSVNTSWTASGMGDGNYAMVSVSIVPADDERNFSDDISLGDIIEAWSSPERINEGITLSELMSGGSEFVRELTESVEFNELLVVLYDLLETGGVSLSGNFLTETDVKLLSENLNINLDMECPYYFESVSDVINIIEQILVENKNVTWREVISPEMVGSHIKLRFKNNEIEQGLYLRDVKVFIDRMDDRESMNAGQYVGEHVRFRIRNNVVDEGLYLEYIRLIGIFRGLLTWQV